MDSNANQVMCLILLSWNLFCKGLYLDPITYGIFFVSEILLEKNCDVNIVDSSGDSALHIACRKGHEAIASLILKTTTSKSLCISHQNKKGQT